MQTQTLMGPRAIPIFLFALACALGLFSLMYAVVHVTGHGAQKSEVLQAVDFVRLRRDSQVESLERRKPPPPPPKPPPPPSKMRVETAVRAGRWWRLRDAECEPERQCGWRRVPGPDG